MTAKGSGGGDAAFEDGFRPTRLLAQDTDDLQVFSSLLQDAVIASTDMAYLPAQKRFALVANRFRWEAADAQERVRTGAHFDGVLAVKRRGFDPSEQTPTPLNLLAVAFEAGEAPPGGVIRIMFSGGADIALTVDAVEGALADMGKPWPATGRPEHEEP